MLNFSKTDSLGQEIKPGDVCIRQVKTGQYNRVIEFCVFKAPSWGGEKSRGEFGRFITPSGERSIKYKNVIFAFDPMSDRRPKSDQVTQVIRTYYESL